MRDLNDLERASAPATRSLAVDPGAAGVTFDAALGATLYVGVAGDVCVDALRDATGTKTVFANVPVGWFPVQVKKLYGSTDGTTADSIVAVW